MLTTLKGILSLHNIELVGAIPMSKCKVIRPYKLKSCGFDVLDGLNVVVFAIPYYTKREASNVSAYASARDYHLFANELFDSVLAQMREKFPTYRLVGFADNSPIAEVHAAAMAGLGVIGDNMMLITDKYSSYVFLGEIITDAPIEVKDDYEIRACEHCGSCKLACPMEKIGTCLSALTQKKGELTPDEQSAIVQYGYAWGCDICQEACPHTKRAIKDGTIYTPIEFFKKDITSYLTKDDVKNMTDEQFSCRAYSWRGKETIARNLEILEKHTKKEEL